MDEVLSLWNVTRASKKGVIIFKYEIAGALPHCSVKQRKKKARDEVRKLLRVSGFKVTVNFFHNVLALH